MNQNKRYLYHLVNESSWLLIVSMGALFFTLFIVFFTMRLDNSLLLVYVNLFMILLMMYSWWKDVIIEATYQGKHTLVVKRSIWIGFILFMLSEVMLFFVFFWGYFHYSLTLVYEIGYYWPGIDVEPVKSYRLPLFNTMILILSGITLTIAHKSLIIGDILNTKIRLLLTILLRVLFAIYKSKKNSEEKKFNIYIFESKSDLDYIRKVVKKKKIRVKYRKEIKRNYPGILNLKIVESSVTKIYGPVVKKQSKIDNVADTHKEGYKAVIGGIDNNTFSVFDSMQKISEYLGSVVKKNIKQIHYENNMEKFSAQLGVDDKVGDRLERQNELANEHSIMVKGSFTAIEALETGKKSEEYLDSITLTTNEGSIPIDHTLDDGSYSSSAVSTIKIKGGFLHKKKEKSANLAIAERKTVTEMGEVSDFTKRPVHRTDTVKEFMGDSFDTLDKGGLAGIYEEYNIKPEFLGALKKKLIN